MDTQFATDRWLADDTERVLSERVVGATDDARIGAVFLDLIDEDWKRSRRRFADLAPEWGLLARRVVWAYPATRLLVEWLHVKHPSFAVELFVRGTDDVRGRVLDADGQLQTEELDDGNVYHSPTVFHPLDW